MSSIKSLAVAAIGSALGLILYAAPAALAGSATFAFNNTLAANESGAPSLASVNPLGNNGFETADVFGQQRTVFKWDGNRTPIDEQAGLTLDTTGLVSPTSYTLELVFEFTEDTGTWRRIFDTTGRTADTGFYVEPGDRLQVYDDVTGTTNFTTNEFHYVAMTVSNNAVKAYLDGKLELNSPTDKLNITSPIVSFFIDNNLGGPAQTEFADGRVALIRLTNGVLSDSQIGQNNPFTPQTPGNPPPPAVPLPAAALAFFPCAAVAGLLGKRLRGAKKVA